MKKSWNRSWATASQWGRNVHVSGKVINSCLVEMGYLNESDGTPTKLGRAHSKWERKLKVRRLLWDNDTFWNVVKYRARQAEVREKCPSCGAYLDEDEKHDFLASIYVCNGCGSICTDRLVEVKYDR